jgi:hypothetical protein
MEKKKFHVQIIIFSYFFNRKMVVKIHKKQKFTSNWLKKIIFKKFWHCLVAFDGTIPKIMFLKFPTQKKNSYLSQKPLL